MNSHLRVKYCAHQMARQSSTNKLLVSPLYLGADGDEALIPVNLELVNLLWLPNIFVYNLKTFKVVITLHYTTLHHIIRWSACSRDTRGCGSPGTRT